MAERINSHVERLHRYLPFTPAHDQIYEEYQRSEDSLNLSTRALEYLNKAVHNDARSVVLTGDAGHGKTHLCRRLIELHLGYEEDEARTLINKACDGSRIIHAKNGGSSPKPLRIYKDISEFTIPTAVQQLENAADDTESATVICANEGRLRAVLESSDAGDVCKRLLEDVRAAFAEGWATRDGTTHVVNLNHQSVASDEGESLARRAVHEWISGTRWRTCRDCDSKDLCPIYHNRNMLSPQESDLAERRRARLENLYATVERLGSVVTIREMLMAIAFLLTGGLRCSDVHSRIRRGRRGWQYRYAFYNLLFDSPPEARSDHLARIPVMLEFARLDPGTRASRAVDERLVNEQGIFGEGQIDIVFERRTSAQQTFVDASSGIDEIIGNPRNARERRSESDFVSSVVRSLRRRAFFDHDSEQDSFTGRLGFEHGDDFLEIIGGDVKPQRMAAMKNLLIAGLHTIQGLQMGLRETTLHLVDPAFGSATSHAAIIARRVPGAAIKLLPRSVGWSAAESSGPTRMNQSVDWLDRHVILRIEGDSGEVRDLPLDLMLFDCVARASTGYVAQEFYGHEIRRVANFLARLAEQGAARDQNIGLSIRGELRSISIDQGVIQVGGGH